MTPEQRLQDERRQQAEIDSRRITDGKIDSLLNNLNQLRQQFVYYILAIAAACIAFTISATQKELFDISLLPVGIAVFFWICSFLSGVSNLYKLEHHISSNIFSLKLYIEDFKHQLIPKFDNETARAKVSGGRYRRFQMIFLMCGAVAFIYWHITKLILNTSQGKTKSTIIRGK